MLETFYVFSEVSPRTVNKHFFNEDAALAYLSSLDDEVEADIFVTEEELPF